MKIIKNEEKSNKYESKSEKQGHQMRDQNRIKHHWWSLDIIYQENGG